MTLEQKISLVDVLISENPDATIKDYLELIGEYPYLDQATDVPQSVPDLPPLPRPRIDKVMRKYYHTARIRL